MLSSKSSIHMKSTFTLSSYDLGAQSIFDEAFDEIEKFENKYSVFKDTPFNQINKNAGITQTIVDNETIDILNLAREFFDISQGKFDICFENPKYNLTQVQIKDEANIKSVYLPFKDMKLNLGGIGKGYCVDKVHDFLRLKGLKNFCVNGGGDMRVSSASNAPRPWRIGIKNPFNPENVVGHVTLTNHALATSGSYLKGEHIKSRSSNQILSITVLSDKCVRSDVFATIGMTLTPTNALQFYNQNSIWASIICDDGSVHLSKQAYKNHMGHIGENQ